MRNTRIRSELADAFISSERTRCAREEEQSQKEYSHRKKREDKNSALILAQLERAGAICKWQNGYVFEGTIGDWHFKLCNQTSRIVGSIHWATDDPNDLWVIRENSVKSSNAHRLRELYGFCDVCYDGKVPGVFYEFLNRLIHDEKRLLEELRNRYSPTPGGER